ncbi:hypothetical protein JOY44_12250 [Phormidium sp. CLA17]|uniref:hypothetical protein n=1 Tax=Leptolyngbya sp. Cla-17 TaxID=2803751 RepID=UPI0014923250|nr:hypothetical protein [Leptolyngbya sp. Cla-17]MBM0742379.1 hypothetical protein [Leptolyngbya sp. Cla-17]
MRLSLYCPSCKKPISDLPRRIPPIQVTCSSCSQQYGVVYGKLSRRSSITEALLYLTSKLPSFYKQHYTFQITTADRTLKCLQFSVPGKSDVIPVHRGDVVSVLYTMQGYVMKQLVAIANHTTGKSYVLPNPVPGTNQHVITLITIVTGFVLLSFLNGGNVFFTSIFSAIGVLTYLKLTNNAHLSNPVLNPTQAEGLRLIADQRLLSQQRKLEQRVTELTHECQSNQVLIEQIKALKQKMTQVDQAIYSARIYRSTTAIDILNKQIANNHRLVREYQHMLKMIEIEIDTSWIADQLPDAENFTQRILERLHELKEIEEHNQALKLQLAAYEEVNLLGIEEYGK